MKKNYHILLLGFFGSTYIVDFVKYLKRENPKVHIYYWGIEPEDKSAIDQEYLDCYDEYSFFENKPKIKIPILQQLNTIFLWRKSFRQFAQNKYFDIVNIHFTRYAYTYILDELKKCSSNIVLTPWGSDVYRMNYKGKLLLRRLYKSAEYITGGDDRFTKDVFDTFDVSDEKLVRVKFGSSLIDYIINYKLVISEEDAKRQLGINNSYVITCGYNALPVQNHIGIIEAINSVRDKLPSNLLLLFPFTYGRSEEYTKRVKNKIEEYNLNALFVEEFLDIPKLFLLRQATDMFVHIQTSDAGSASVREYLLCGKKVVNGGWLRYSELEQEGVVPYFITESIDTLNKVLLIAYEADSPNISRSSFKCIEDKAWKTAIKGWSDFFSGIS